MMVVLGFARDPKVPASVSQCVQDSPVVDDFATAGVKNLAMHEALAIAPDGSYGVHSSAFSVDLRAPFEVPQPRIFIGVDGAGKSIFGLFAFGIGLAKFLTTLKFRKKPKTVEKNARMGALYHANRVVDIQLTWHTNSL